MKKISFALVAIILLFTLALDVTAFSPVKKILEYPQLKAKTLDGQEFDLSKKNGTTVLVIFWASWCVECRHEMAELSERYSSYKDKGVEIIGISVDEESERGKAEKIAANLPFKNVIWIDSKKEKSNFKWLNDFGEQYVIPANYLIDKTGKLRSDLLTAQGAIDNKDFEKILKNVTANNSPIR